jgi:hypothetical protein
MLRRPAQPVVEPLPRGESRGRQGPGIHVFFSSHSSDDDEERSGGWEEGEGGEIRRARRRRAGYLLVISSYQKLQPAGVEKGGERMISESQIGLISGSLATTCRRTEEGTTYVQRLVER